MSPGRAQIPEYLRQYIVEQDPSLYTPMDHAGWRFILKISRAFFANHAHQKYLDGLVETGITSERIPLIDEMDERLSRFGWGAVAVSGFIPPAAFMEFLARGVLPIACDMRKHEHLGYTPAPDIVHEAAGHAPIIADPEYADYLHHYGELAEKAIFSKQDLDVYEAVRNLSDLKEDPTSTAESIQQAQARLDRAVASVDHESEATQLGRMGWWTIEYGLLGDPEDPKIYGAGLLSSVAESYNCLSPGVRKLPLTLDCIHQNFDITRPQPQLYLARDFHELTRVLQEFSRTMAYRRGGREGLLKARKAETTTTTELDTGLQISGTLRDFHEDASEFPIYLQFQGPTQLAYRGLELPAQGPRAHRDGFGTPMGCLRGSARSPASLATPELEELGFRDGARGKLTFESGVVVEGRLTGKVIRHGQNLLLSFEDCRVTLGDQVLFRPEWGSFDMACGTSIASVFGGAADRKRYLEATGGFQQAPGRPKTNLTEQNRALNELYARVRRIREESPDDAANELSRVHALLEERHRDDWLLRYELLELNSALQLNSPWEKTVRERLSEISGNSREKSAMIRRGLELIAS